MSQSVDIDLLRRVTFDSICVYEALNRAQTLSVESQHIVAMAEDLLRQVGLAYLLNDVKIKADQPAGSPTFPKEIVSAYVQIQQSYADLKNALYQLAKAHTEARAWNEAHAVIEGLFKIDPQYRDTGTLLRQNLLNQAKDLFEQRKWEEGRTILKLGPADKELRLTYLSSFLDEDASIEGVRALQKEEPQVSKLPSFQRVVSNAATLSEAEYQLRIVYRVNGDPVAARRQHGDAQYDFDDSLSDLKAELSSIISESK